MTTMCQCGLGHRGWEPQKCRIELSRRAREAVNTKAEPESANPVLTSKSEPTGEVLTHLAVGKPTTDRHKPGYMAEYMRKRRAKAAPAWL